MNIPINKIRRRLCFLLACVLLLGLFPVPSRAADAPQSTISLREITWSSTTYQSDYFQRPCQIQDFGMNVGGQVLSGFCGDHSLHLNNRHIGDTWSNPQEVTNSAVKTMMAYYYTHLLGEEYWNDVCIAKGFNYVVSGDAILQYNGWIQEVVWMWSTGQIPSDYAGQVEMVAQAYRESFDARNGTSHASIDDQIVADNPNTFRTVTELILSNTDAWCECPVYRYVHPDSDVQPILVGYPKKVTRVEEKYKITVKKVDSSNQSLSLAGATFRLESATDDTFEPKTATTNNAGSCVFDNLLAGTYKITEVSAPTGYTIDSAGPDYVTLPGNGQASVTKVFTDTPTVTVSGSIRKVDKDNPTTGLAGATIAIQGVDNNFYGEYQTGAGGALEGLDWSSLTTGSYKAWEIGAPEGYTLDSSDVKTFRIDANNSDVKLVFMDDAKVKVQLLKLDASGSPLTGAVFNVIRDGQVIASEATNASGQITVSNVSEGMYAFVEVSAPAGYAKVDEPALVYVDQAAIQGGGTVSVAAVDKKLPNLTIEKKDGKTGEAVPGTVFEVKGIHFGFHEDVTTGGDGTATLTGIPVDSYEVTEKSVPDPYVLGGEPTQTVWLGGGDHRTLIFTNLKEPMLTVKKIDAADSRPVPGTVFSVEGIDNRYKADWTMGTDGSYSLRLEPGSYKITEKSVPEPYCLDAENNVRTVLLAAGDEQEIVFKNQKNPQLTVKKIDASSGAAVPGTVFTVQGVDNRYKADWTMETDGSYSLRLEPGTYKVTEKSVPEPYCLDTDNVRTISLAAGDEKELVFEDQKKPQLTVKKIDAADNAPVPGTVFTVRGVDNSYRADWTMGTDGSYSLRLEPGTYKITEKSVPEPYCLDENNVQTIALAAGDEKKLVFKNQKNPQLTISKTDAEDGRPVPGTVFTVEGIDNRYKSEWTTGTTGTASERLEPGSYRVTEKSVPAPYFLPEKAADRVQSIALAAGDEKELVFRDHRMPTITIYKEDSVAGAPIEGTQFHVTYTSTGESAEAPESCDFGTLYTDEKGEIRLHETGIRLHPGEYTVTETKAAPGFQMKEPTTQKVIIHGSESKTLTFQNEPLNGVFYEGGG